MESGFLLPDLDDVDTHPFWEGTARGELLVQHCGECGRSRMPPRPMCPHCNSTKQEWKAMSGRGTVWSFVVPHPPLLPAYEKFAPYNVITVALDDDPSIRFVGNLIALPDAAINSVDPKTIRIGDAVRVIFQQVEDVHLPRWIRA
jgi:uncharacterized protein